MIQLTTKKKQHKPIRSLSSPDAVVAVEAGVEENPPNVGAGLFPLVRLPRPLNPPSFPKPENAAGAELPLAFDEPKENPLKPLNAPPLSACDSKTER